MPINLASKWNIPTQPVSVLMANESNYKHIQTIAVINIKLVNIIFLIYPVCIGTRVIIDMDILHKTEMEYNKGKFINNLNSNHKDHIIKQVKDCLVSDYV